ncbi:peptidoglycan-binding protein [Candidatus Kaiserbacteria bacterium]|nr:peptidoglycan-binding protein [Candidatus Kaiserbacteria bacterium]
MKKLLSTLSLIGMMVLPLSASAQTVDINSLIAQTQALIAQINALQAQQGYTSATAPATTVASNAGTMTAGICPTLSRALGMGASGNDVSSLQQFLAQDPSVYPDKLVTGYFGALTQAAVQRWQFKYGIVSSGTPDSNGFGVVGPRTKAAIMAQCVPGVTSQTGTPSVASGFISVSPATGNAPLTTTVTATVNTSNSCAGTPYTLDFGDGPTTRQFIATAGNCSQQVKTFTHTYTAGGVYTVTLSAGGHQTSATVTVNGGGAQTGGVDSIHASVASGTVPLLVTFTGSVNADDARRCDQLWRRLIHSCTASRKTAGISSIYDIYRQSYVHQAGFLYCQPDVFVHESECPCSDFRVHADHRVGRRCRDRAHDHGRQ